MILRKQYIVTPFALKALAILTAHPGLQASEFAAMCWPKMRKGGLLASLHLGSLVEKGLIWQRFEPPLNVKDLRGGPKPRKHYYVTDKGFTVHDFAVRQNRNAPHHDRTG